MGHIMQRNGGAVQGIDAGSCHEPVNARPNAFRMAGTGQTARQDNRPPWVRLSVGVKVKRFDDGPGSP